MVELFPAGTVWAEQFGLLAEWGEDAYGCGVECIRRARLLGERMHIEKFTLWERATHIPLLLHVPDRYDSQRAFDAPVSAIDMGPTLAGLCGAEIHE